MMRMAVGSLRIGLEWTLLYIRIQTRRPYASCDDQGWGRSSEPVSTVEPHHRRTPPP
jgi:hypothetical protein